MGPFATPDEIPRDAAIRAYNGTSHVPERRADAIRQEYADRLNNAHAKAMQGVKTKGQEVAVNVAMVELKQRYKSAFMAWLGSRAGVTSWMITGRSGRNARREQKKSDTSDRRAQDAEKVWAQGVKRVNNALKAEVTSEAGGEVGVTRNRLADAEKTQAAMKAANRIVRAKKGSAEDKIARLVAEVGLAESTARKILEPDFMGKLGFPTYALTNNNALIKRLKAKEVELSREPVESVEYDFSAKGFTVEIDGDDNRLRLHFDDKPDDAMRTKLKSRGFKWSRANMAWQRQLTDNARRAAGAILDVDLFSPPSTITEGHMIQNNRCRAPDGRFVDNAECGLAPAPPRAHCRDARGNFIPTPACRGKGSKGLSYSDLAAPQTLPFGAVFNGPPKGSELRRTLTSGFAKRAGTGLAEKAIIAALFIGLSRAYSKWADSY